MHDESRAWALYEDSVLLRFQPVFTAQGQVHEYAVQGRNRASPWQGLAPSGMGASLLAGVAFFNKYGAAHRPVRRARHGHGRGR